MEPPTKDDAETVDAFLERIASLKLRRDREDEERTRKLEEEILQGRKERQARRAGMLHIWSASVMTKDMVERARSLSPSKTGPSTPVSYALEHSSPKPTQNASINPPVTFMPSPRIAPSDHTQVSPPLSASQHHEDVKPLSPLAKPAAKPPSQNATSLARSGTLSWQQRPSSRDSNSTQSRPLSGTRTERTVATQGKALREDAPELTRDQIALSLGTRDPSWFKQTADRGHGSAAYRKNDEDSARSQDLSSRQGLRLPGMSRESTAEPEMDVPAMGERSSLPSAASSLRASTAMSNRFSSVSSISSAAAQPTAAVPNVERIASTKPMDLAQAVDIPPSQNPIQPRSAFERPSSPTKGLGGFVQSAMMKRSDSVNKRWSAQAGPGLRRGDSVASNRNTLGAPTALTSSRRSESPMRETTPSKTSSPANSRPTSSHGPGKPLDTVSALAKETSASRTEPGSGRVTPKDEQKLSLSTELSQAALPISPSKSMDPKRWSPNKSSWLESALQKPDSPKVTVSTPNQPSWMADLQRSKHSRSDSIKSPPSSFDVVNTTGLLRSPPPGSPTKPAAVNSLLEVYSSSTRKPPDTKTKPEMTPDTPLPIAEPPEPTTSPKPSNIEKADSKQLPASDALNASMPNPDLKKSTDLPITSSSTPLPAIRKVTPTVKPKPQTSPKTDFRANLKSRQKDALGPATEEPEFKSMFGRLKRTETKNYVAPDELKNNILRGKADLTLTDGPQKTKRVDEFKDSILQRKDSMKADAQAGLDRRPPTAPKPESKALPEALARRNMLTKSEQIRQNPVQTSTSHTLSPAVLQQSQKANSPIPISPRLASGELLAATTPITKQEPIDNARPESTSDPIAGRQPVQTSQVPPIETAGTVKLPSQATKATAPSGNKFADRLAGLLSRGPGSQPGSANQSTEDLSSALTTASRQPTTTNEDPSELTGELTHMTKGRARGPKRRAPKSVAVVEEPAPSVAKSSEPSGTVQRVVSPRPTRGRPLADLINNNDRLPPPKPRTPSKQIQPLEQEDDGRPVKSDVQDSESLLKPPVVAKSPELGRVAAPVHNISSEIATRPESHTASQDVPNPKIESQANDKSADTRSISGNFEASGVTVSAGTISKDSSPLDWKNEIISSMKPQKSLPTPSNVSQASVNGVGLASKFTPTQQVHRDQKQPSHKASVTATALPPSASSSAKNPPVAPAKPKTKAEPVLAVKSQPLQSVANQQSPKEAVRAFEIFFEETPRSEHKADFDVQSAISASQMPEKVKTTNMQIWEINGDGRQTPLPPKQEHILFEECMYLCVHSLEDSRAVKASEVYLWAGDGVAEAGVEDAQLFCRKVGRENNAKIQVLRQGKETARFFQALGGIVITRRLKSAALYMLCARKHLEHMAFDEVDMEPSSLCSGFAYIISAKFGKLYLWKGKGSGAEELGCARLIGMDLGLTGEMEEVAEGEEPAGFFESLSALDNDKPPQQDRWATKKEHDKYHTRLFRIEHEQPRSIASFWGRRGSSPAKSAKTALITEILPFSQRDLEVHHLYVFDAYFEIFV